MSKWNFKNNGSGKHSDNNYTSTLGGASKTNTYNSYNYSNTGGKKDDAAYDAWWSKYSTCHTGNNLIFAIGDGNLWAGGWTRGAKPEAGWYVLDLAEHYSVNASTGPGFEKSLGQLNKNYAVQVVSLYIKDFDIPAWDRDFWLALAEDVRDMLMRGTNILVACDGGHGRTGLMLAILCHLLDQCQGSDPIEYVRKLYCENCVETLKQEQYVYDICGLTAPVHSKYSTTGSTCIICSERLYPDLGDDMEAEICDPCIKRWGMTKADKDKAVKEHSEIVKSGLGDTVLEGEVRDLHAEEAHECLGTCGFCGANLDENDAADYGMCAPCYQWALDQGYPLNY